MAIQSTINQLFSVGLKFAGQKEENDVVPKADVTNPKVKKFAKPQEKRNDDYAMKAMEAMRKYGIAKYNQRTAYIKFKEDLK